MNEQVRPFRSHAALAPAATAATSASAPGSPLPHLHRDGARPCHICARTIASRLPHLHRDWAIKSALCTSRGHSLRISSKSDSIRCAACRARPTAGGARASRAAVQSHPTCALFARPLPRRSPPLCRARPPRVLPTYSNVRRTPSLGRLAALRPWRKRPLACVAFHALRGALAQLCPPCATEACLSMPHLHRDWAHPSHICTSTGLALPTSS